MKITTKQKNSFGEWTQSTTKVLSISEPHNVRGRITGSNWAVNFEVPSTLGKTGKQTRTKYFSRKTEAMSWINNIKKS